MLERLIAERDFLLARCSNAGQCIFSDYRWTGISSNALVTVAFGGDDNALPWDSADLAACYRTVQRLPDHLRTSKVLRQLEAGEHNMGKEQVDLARTKTGWPGVSHRTLTEGDPEAPNA